MTSFGRSRGGAVVVLVAVAAVVAVGLAILWRFTLYSGTGAALDFSALRIFFGLQRPRLVHPLTTFTSSAGPVPFGVMACGLVLGATMRRNPLMAGAVAVILAGANGSTELLKSVLPGRAVFFLGPITSPTMSYPSGHATACMSLVLGAVLVASPRWRVAVAAAGSVYALALGCAMLVLAAHYPSDVIGGYGMAWLWALMALAAVRCVAPRRRPPTSDQRPRVARESRARLLSTPVPEAVLLCLVVAGAGWALEGGAFVAAVSVVGAGAVVPVLAIAMLIGRRSQLDSAG